MFSRTTETKEEKKELSTKVYDYRILYIQ